MGNLSAMEKKHGEQTEKLQKEIKVLQKEAEGLFKEIHFTLWLSSPGSLAQKREIFLQQTRIECHLNSLLSSFALFWSTDWQNYGRIFAYLLMVWLVDFFFKSFTPKISMHILHTDLYTYPKVLMRRICWKSRASFVGDHFLYSHKFNVRFRVDIVRRN